MVIKGYRKIQLLSSVHNFVLQNPMMPISMAGTIVAEVASVYIVLSQSGKLPHHVIMPYLILAVDISIFIHFIFKKVSGPHIDSAELIQFTKGKYARDTWGRRFVRSCPSVKVKIADGHFFDKTTSLMIWDFCIDYVITLLLT